MQKVMKISRKLFSGNRRRKNDEEDSADEIVNLEDNQTHDEEQDVDSVKVMEGQEGTTCGTEEETKANEGTVQPIPDVKRHMLQRCKERMKHLQGNDQDKEIYESAIGEERKTLKNFLFNMCISPNEFEDRSYSKNELLELFMEYGHIVVPERFAATFKPPQRVRSSLATELFPTVSDPDSRRKKTFTAPTASSTPKRSLPSEAVPTVVEDLPMTPIAPSILVLSPRRATHTITAPPPTSVEEPEPTELPDMNAADTNDDGYTEEPCRRTILPIPDYDEIHKELLNNPVMDTTPDFNEMPLEVTPEALSPVVLIRSRKTVRILEEGSSLSEPNVEERDVSVELADDDQVEGLRRSPRLKKKPASATEQQSPKGTRHVAKPVEELQYFTERKKALLQESGFNNVPEDYANQIIFDGFLRFFEQQNKPGNINSQHVRNVVRALYWMGNGSTTFLLDHMDIRRLEEFQGFIAPKVAPNTLANYFKSLKLWILYITHQCKEYASHEDQLILSHITFNIRTLSKGNDKTRREEHRRKRTEDDLPPTPFECQKILNLAKKDVLDTMKTDNKNRDDIARINRYIAAFACCGMGNRPSAITNFRLQDYERALHKEKETIGDEKYMVIGLSEHKTGDHYTAHLILDSFWMKLFKDYLELVREPVKNRTGSTAKEFLLQYNGRKFEKVTDGVTKLHTIYNCPTILPGVARKSYETYTQNLPKETQDRMTQYLCHTADVRDRYYRKTDPRTMTEMYKLQQDMCTYYGSHSAREIPASFSKGNDKDEPPAVSNSHTTSRIKEPIGQEASRTKPDPTTRSHTPSKRPRRNIDTSDEMIPNIEEPEQAARSHTPSKRSKRRNDTSTDEMCIEQEDNEDHKIKTISTNIIQKLRDSNHGTMMKTEVPAKEEVLDKFHVSEDAAVKIIRRIRYFKQKDELLAIAQRLIAKESKRKHKKISDLETPSIDVDNPIFKSIVTQVCGEKKGGKQTEKDRTIDKKNKEAINILMAEIINKEKSKVTSMTDQEIMQHIYQQDWPHCRTAYRAAKGKIVCNGVHSIPAGTIVCDYHGNHMTHIQGEQRLRSIEKDEDANYMLFYRHPVNGKRMCVDAATIPCQCHRSMKSGTMGRLISHSATAPNLKPVARMIGGQPRVLLIATEVIKGSAEFVFDYGVRRSETGEEISWLQE